MDPVSDAESTRSRLSRRSFIWIARIGTVLSLAAIGFLWVRSWSQIDYKSFRLGSYTWELHLAGSSCAVSLSNPRTSALEPQYSVGIDSASGLSLTKVNWIGGDLAGTVEHSAWAYPFPPVSAELDRFGSFGGGYFNSAVFHLRFPVWFLIAGVLAGWLWTEHAVRRRQD